MELRAFASYLRIIECCIAAFWRLSAWVPSQDPTSPRREASLFNLPGTSVPGIFLPPRGGHGLIVFAPGDELSQGDCSHVAL